MRVTGRTRIIMASAALASAGVVGAYALHSRIPDGRASSTHIVRPVWTETRWPFPVDPWGKGKAFRCKALDCGNEVNLYVRAKLGFCNCTSGIADDADLDRMDDLELIDHQAMPLGTGRPITVGSMQGRSRAYSLSGSQNRNDAAISIAFNERCDMVAATVLLRSGALATIEPIVINFLNSEPMLQWAEVTLGL
ncbi:hypothetical protein [Microvirga massiliensis]|uniref:hypothetical protein n=1 Tax=Microvirga massiliensis TaxID=1033741 RepID=UPI00062BD4CE|nr:hypothetical protein [Microvirga massiliensis]